MLTSAGASFVCRYKANVLRIAWDRIKMEFCTGKVNFVLKSFNKMNYFLSLVSKDTIKTFYITLIILLCIRV